MGLAVKNISFRLVALLCFAAGVFASSLMTDEPAPGVFTVRLQPEPETIIQGRDLTLYDVSERHFDCLNYAAPEGEDCDASAAKSRKFILAHWRAKKRAYISIETIFTDGANIKHIFIEPDKEGNWRAVIREEYSASRRGFSGAVAEETTCSIKLELSDKMYDWQPDTYYLAFLDKDGKEVYTL